MRAWAAGLFAVAAAALACGGTARLTTGGEVHLTLTDAGSLGAQGLTLDATGKQVIGNAVGTQGESTKTVFMSGQTQNWTSDSGLRRQVEVTLFDVPVTGQRLVLRAVTPSAMQATVDYVEREGNKWAEWTSDTGTLVIDAVDGAKVSFHTEGGHFQPRRDATGLATFSLVGTVDHVNGL